MELTDRVLVSDGEQRAALAVVRSLGRSGATVFVCSTRERALAGASRYCKSQAVVRDPLRDAAGFAGDVARLCGQWRIDTLIPITEPSLLALLPLDRRPPGVRLPFPPLEAFQAASNKRGLLERAQSVGLAVPQQIVLEDRARAESLTADALHFPVVIKPHRSVGEVGSERVKLSVLYAADEAELRSRVAELPGSAFPILIQQRITGPGVGIFLLMWAGKARAIFAHRRLREKPPAGGVSVYSESVPADPALVARAVDLLERFDWQGVAMLELKVDAATGTPYVMEVNGRFWGSLQLAIDAGVDFPRLLLECAQGTAPERASAYRAGVRSRWWWGDVDHLLARVRRTRKALNLPADASSRGRAVLDFLRVWQPGDRSEVFRMGDPLPLVRETVDWLARR